MKIGIKIGILLLLLRFTAFDIKAQDIHFSQFYAAEPMLTPTGVMQDADYFIGINYKNQWGWASSISNYTYRTLALSGGSKVSLDLIPAGDQLWLGGYILRDVAGDGSLTFNRLNLNIAYSRSLDRFNRFRLTAGFGSAVVQRSIDTDKFTFDNQWDNDPGIFDTNIPSGETFDSERYIYPDLSASLRFSYESENQNAFELGAALHHINRPGDSFLRSENKIGLRLNNYLHALYNINEDIKLYPSLYFATQKKASEWVGGMNAGFKVAQGSQFEGELLTGLWYRVSDALIPAVGYVWEEWQAILSYDINVSGLSSYSNYRGGIELSLYYRGFVQRESDIIRIPCPRL